MNYQFDSIVTRKEADALKDMIFKRVRERSQAMTDDVQADIMAVARESFVNSNNPFSKLINKEESQEKLVKSEKTETKAAEPNQKTEEKSSDIGFPKREEVTRAATQNKIIKEQITNSQIQNNMIEARQELSNRKSFMGALEFLNSRAAVSLMRTRADKFEVVV